MSVESQPAAVELPPPNSPSAAANEASENKYGQKHPESGRHQAAGPAARTAQNFINDGATHDIER